MVSARLTMRYAVDGPVWLADRARWAWLKLLGPFAKPLVRDRELRVAVVGVTLIGLALVAALTVPLWVLALGPIVWGTPHVVSDLRYLWVRPGHHRRIAMWLAVVGPLVGLTVSAHPAWGFGAALGAALVGQGRWWRRGLAAVFAATLILLAWRFESAATLGFAHAHNFVAVGLWWSWRSRRGRLHWVPLGAFVVGCVVLLVPGVDALALGAGGLSFGPRGGDLLPYLLTLGPGAATPWALRCVLLFTFAQSVHYAIWVRLVPEEDRPRETPRTFAASLRALRQDFGTPILLLSTGLALAVGLWALVDLMAARAGYLRAVLFHGHLELAAAVVCLVEGRRSGRA